MANKWKENKIKRRPKRDKTLSVYQFRSGLVNVTQSDARAWLGDKNNAF